MSTVVDTTRTVERLVDLLHQAHGHGVELVVYPELALTTFFSRWNIEDAEGKPRALRRGGSLTAYLPILHAKEELRRTV